MKNFLLCPLCLSMICCGENNNNPHKNDLLCDYRNLIISINKTSERQADCVKLAKVAPALFTIKKTKELVEKNNEIGRDDKDDRLYESTLQFIENANEENMHIFFGYLKEETISNFFREIVKKLLGNSCYISLQNEGIKKKYETNYIHFTKDKIAKLRGEQVKGNEKISITDLLNRHFKGKKSFLLNDAKPLVVEVESMEGLTKGKEDRLELFKGLVSGGAVLKYVCSFVENGGYDEEMDILGTDLPKWLTRDNEKEGTTFFVFEILKVNDRKIKNLENDE